VAGGCGNGALTQAGKRNVFSIGVDADQSYVDSSVIASALKRVDVATYDAIQEVKNGSFQGGIQTFGLANNGVGYQIDHLSNPPSDLQSALNNMISQIKSGAVTVPDTVGS
jgi:basic membrane protein A